MKLNDLQADFVRAETEGVARYRSRVPFDLAHGLRMLCPGCFAKNGGPVGTHSILVWFARRGVPEGEHPLPRWDVQPGSGSLESLTLSPSIDAGCWHGWVRDGEALP